MSTQMQGWHPVSSGNPSGDGLLSVNPYRGQNYLKSPWQNFLTSLGFRTQSDAWLENMNVQAAEYDAAIAQKLRDEEYNLPINQTARLRAAGINPDLDGGSGIDAGSAQPLGEDLSTPMQSTGDEVQLLNFGQSILSCVSSAFGIVQAVQGITGNSIKNRLGETQVENAVRDLSKGIFIDSLPDVPIVEGEWSVEDSRSFALSRAENLIGKQLPKKIRKKALDYISNYWDSAPATKEAYSQWLEGAKNSKGYFGETSMFYSELPELMREIYEPLGKMNEDIYKARQNADFEGASADFEENQNRGEIAAQIDTGVVASAQNATNRRVAASESIQASMHTAFQQITDNLEKASHKGGVAGIFASAMLVMMSMQQMNMLPSLPSFSSSRTMGPKGLTTSTSFGF